MAWQFAEMLPEQMADLPVTCFAPSSWVDLAIPQYFDDDFPEFLSGCVYTYWCLVGNGW